MHLKKIASALLALLMGLFTGCRNRTSHDDGAFTEQADTAVTIAALNVGKADCFVIRTPQSVTMIDTGTEESVGVIERYLHQQGISRIDQLYISHFDRDHVGGADHIIAQYDIGQVYSTYYVAKESDDIDEYSKALQKKGLSPVLVDSDRTVSLDGVTWQLFPPQKEDYKKDVSNNSSLVVRMTFGQVSALFTGDAKKARIKELLEMDGLQSDILKIPHHGAYEKNLDDLLEQVQPKYAILTGSDEQPEDEDTLQLLKQCGVTAYSTRKGHVVFTTDGEDITVEQ